MFFLVLVGKACPEPHMAQDSKMGGFSNVTGRNWCGFPSTTQGGDFDNNGASDGRRHIALAPLAFDVLTVRAKLRSVAPLVTMDLSDLNIKVVIFGHVCSVLLFFETGPSLLSKSLDTYPHAGTRTALPPPTSPTAAAPGRVAAPPAAAALAPSPGDASPPPPCRSHGSKKCQEAQVQRGVKEVPMVPCTV